MSVKICIADAIMPCYWFIKGSALETPSGQLHGGEPSRGEPSQVLQGKNHLSALEKLSLGLKINQMVTMLCVQALLSLASCLVSF